MQHARDRLLFEHVGAPALAYILATDEQAIIARFGLADGTPLEGVREDLLSRLAEIDAVFTQRPPHFNYWAEQMGLREGDAQVSFGNNVRQLAGGEVYVPPSQSSEVEDVLASMTVDAYPSLIIKDVEEAIPRTSVTVSLFRTPLNEKFQELVMKHVDLQLLYSETSDSGGPVGSLIRSTGRGGGHQLWGLAERLISYGWRLARRESDQPSVAQVVDAALTGLHAITTAVRGEHVTTPALVGLAGVLLPDSVEELDFGWGRLRKVDERESRIVSETNLNGQLQTSTPDGRLITINYSGDLVLEFEVPYELRIQQRDENFLDEWPDDLLANFRLIEEYVQNMRLGLLLALPEKRPILAQTWQVLMDPFESTEGSGWSDPRYSVVGLSPIQLTAEETAKWRQWTVKIGELRTPSIAVAIRRMLMAVAERRSPDDVLVDAVIVWENLFGASTETTLRVSSSLAWLLGDTPEKRRGLQAEYKRIYGFRSTVVHGTAAIDQKKLQQYAQEAVQISIEALKKIFQSRPELLELKSSEDRSLAILHAGIGG